MTLEALKELGKNYVSIIAGGYEVRDDIWALGNGSSGLRK